MATPTMTIIEVQTETRAMFVLGSEMKSAITEGFQEATAASSEGGLSQFDGQIAQNEKYYGRFHNDNKSCKSYRTLHQGAEAG